MGQPHGHRPEGGGQRAARWPGGRRLGAAVEIEQHAARPAPGRSTRRSKPAVGIVEVVEHPQAGDEVEALGGERGRPQVRLDHQHGGVVGQVAGGRLDRRRAVEGGQGAQVLRQKAGVAALSAAGVQADLAGQTGQVEIAEVDLGEPLVLLADIVEGVPLESEAGEGPLRSTPRRDGRRAVEVAVPHGVAVAGRAAALPRFAWGGLDRFTTDRAAQALDDPLRYHCRSPSDARRRR